jgi:DNA-binding LytR/AlgR family response regulator
MKFQLIIDENAEEELILRLREASALSAQIQALLSAYEGRDSITGFRENEMRKLAFREVECITVRQRRVYAIDTEGREYRLRQSLRELEELLPSTFIRINKSALANEDRILRFHTVFSGAVDAVFRCGYREYVSRRCFAEIKRRYEEL